MAKKLADPEAPKRGRPALGVKPTLVRLPEGVPERIDALAGPKRRAEFIRDATVAELERQEAAAGKMQPIAEGRTSKS